MIPYAVLQGELYISPDEKISIRILDLSLEGFTFRLLKSRSLFGTERLVLYFWSWKTSEYQRLELDSFYISEAEEDGLYTVYRIETEEESFTKAASDLMADYLHYIELKQSGDDAYLSECLTGYPAEEEKKYSGTLEEWVGKRLSAAERKLNEDPSRRKKWTELLSRMKSLGVEVESDEMQAAFLHMNWGDFRKYYWRKQQLMFHPVSDCEIHFLYLGNGYCFQRLPYAEQMAELIQKSDQVNRIPIMVLPPLKEGYREQFVDFLDRVAAFLDQRGKEVETVVNDWGTLELIRQRYSNYFLPVMGILMNKRRKDSRMVYRTGLKQQLKLLKENGSNAGFYRKYLADNYQLRSFLYESCGYKYDLPEGEHSIFFPFYQMNTAGHCTLYAEYKKGKRGRQTREENCPGFCRQHYLLYPDFLSMIGWQNSLFAWDERILWDADYFESLSEYGKHRMILQELHLNERGKEK